MTRTIHTTATGRRVDLLRPTAADIEWDAVAEHLAKENRYNGATPGVAFPVAEHELRGAWAIEVDYAEDPRLGEIVAWWLIHDVPEWLLKDDPTPKKRALEAIAVEKFGVLAGAITAAFDELTERHERAAAAAAGLAWPCPPWIAKIVKRYDAAMLATEWRDLMPFEPPRDLGPTLNLRWPIVPIRWQDAKTSLLLEWNRWLPALQNGWDQSKGDYQFPDGTPLKNAADD